MPKRLTKMLTSIMHKCMHQLDKFIFHNSHPNPIIIFVNPSNLVRKKSFPIQKLFKKIKKQNTRNWNRFLLFDVFQGWLFSFDSNTEECIRPAARLHNEQQPIPHRSKSIHEPNIPGEQPRSNIPESLVQTTTECLVHITILPAVDRLPIQLQEHKSEGQELGQAD